MLTLVVLTHAVLSATTDGAVPACVQPTDSFNQDAFRNPDSVHWPAYFWLWNAPLEPDVLRSQLRNMTEHGARSVCMLPMPKAFRPDSTNNQMEPDYLTSEFLQRVRLAVDEAASFGMKWWLYDEGGWPSGHALGKVTDGHPEFRQCTLTREVVSAAQPVTVPDDALALVVEGATPAVLQPRETWTPAKPEETAYIYRVTYGGYADLLNPAAVQRFIELTHAAYATVLTPDFGKTVLFTFTDECHVPSMNPPKSIPWSPGIESDSEKTAGKDILAILPLLFADRGSASSVDAARARVEFCDVWSKRFQQAYFGQIRDWCREHDLASGGHLGDDHETAKAGTAGYGSALRQLRALDMPGVDVIWRQLMPGLGEQSNFPKFASSAAHLNGTRYSFTESFCVYGNGLTPAQMKWLVDYQYIRGINLFVGGCRPLTTRDHHMTGERPHIGPMDPLWDHLGRFHAHVARLGYALSTGLPQISTALYYPARDLWAFDAGSDESAKSHDRLAAELMARQCDYDCVDDDSLAAPTTRIENSCLAIGPMRYDTVLCGSVRWMAPAALERLKEFAVAGGKVLCVSHEPGSDGNPGSSDNAFCLTGTQEEIAEQVAPLAVITPPGRMIRASARRTEEGRILALFNEGESLYEGRVAISAPYAYCLDSMTGGMRKTVIENHSLAVTLEPWETVLFILTDSPADAEPELRPTADTIRLDDQIQAKPLRHFVVGEHDFEQQTMDGTESAPFAQASVWKDWLTEDFSGEVEYRATFDIPAEWANSLLDLRTGPVEYAATVYLDGKEVGSLLWAPWRVILPACSPGRHELVIRVANTLANELTSDRVKQAWDAMNGPGWPSPYHKRALEFEKESRGGGLRGPVELVRLEAIS